MKKITALLIPLLLTITAATANCWTMDLIWERQGYLLDGMFGSAVTGLGDINNDGYTDFLIAEPRNDKVYLFYGGNPPDTIPDIIYDIYLTGLWGGIDLNGNDRMDFIGAAHNNVYIWLDDDVLTGEPSISFTLPEWRWIGALTNQFTLGDFNGDDYTDFGFVAWSGDVGGLQGVYVYFNSLDIDTIPNIIINPGDLPEMRNLYSIDLNGDFNRSQCSDLLLGSTNGGIGVPGYLYLFKGGPYYDIIPDLTLTEAEQGIHGKGQFFGDINNDGYDDIAVSAPYMLFTYLGNSSFDVIPYDTIFSPNYEASRIGDLNRDGYDDFISEHYYGSYCVHLWRGSISETFAITDFCTPMVGYGGGPIAFIGDIDGNGCGDILIGSRSAGMGIAKLYSGNPGGVPGIEEEVKLPTGFQINNIYPNPFNTTFSISYYLPTNSKVDFEIYNILGRLIKRYETERRFKGKHTESLKMPSGTSSGLYFLMAKYGDERIVRKVTFLK